MALKIETTLPNGIVVNYYKIAGIYIHWQALLVNVDMAVYLNEITRRSGLNPVEIKTFYFNQNDFFITDGSSIRADTYRKLKTLPDFIKATDV